MPKRTNWFQQLVTSLEVALTPGDFEVTESKSYLDESADVEREVDIVIDGKVGAHSFCVGIECIDHARKGDVTWVEQIWAKHQKLPINKTVLVSRSGLTKGAIKKCKSLHIEHVIYTEGKSPDWARWIRRTMVAITISIYGPIIKNLAFCIMGPGNGTPKGVGNDTLVMSSDEPTGISVKSLLLNEVNSQQFHESAYEVLSAGKSATVTVAIPLPKGAYFLDESGTKFELVLINADLEMRADDGHAAPMTTGSYKEIAFAYSMDESGRRILITEAEEGESRIAVTTPAPSPPGSPDVSETPTGIGVKIAASNAANCESLALTDAPMSRFADCELEIPDRIKKEYLRPFEIRASDVRATVFQPDNPQAFFIEGWDDKGKKNPFLFFAKRIDSFGIIVACAHSAGSLQVQMAYKVPKAIYCDDSNPAPLTLLRRLAEEFGMDVTVGGLTSRFIFACRVPMVEGKPTNLIGLPKKPEYGKTTLLVKMSTKNRCVECALCFTIDYDRYGRAIGVGRPRTKRKRNSQKRLKKRRG